MRLKTTTLVTIPNCNEQEREELAYEILRQIANVEKNSPFNSSNSQLYAGLKEECRVLIESCYNTGMAFPSPIKIGNSMLQYVKNELPNNPIIN